MSWFSGSTVPVADLELKINEATSESIPNGELDLSIALEITDLIRSKKIPPKQCMRSLKKRLTTTYSNPNLLTLTLKLVDLCVKNGGYHFLVELSSKEFIDYLVDYVFKIHFNIKDTHIIENEAKYKVGSFILSLIKDWALVFESRDRLGYVERIYHQLMNQGYEFPDLEVDGQLSNKFIDSEAPPDWIDSNECMICYNPFSLINRKHHCRSCGGVYCQTHSSHNSPLVALGIMEQVRVCDNCYEKIKSKNNKNLSKVKRKKTSSPPTEGDLNDEDEQLRKAIELSLHESQVPVSNPIPPPKSPSPVANNRADEEDEEMKAAIAASLKEFEAQENMYKQQPTSSQQTYQEAQSEFYKNILPFDHQDPSYQIQNQNQPTQPARSHHLEQYHMKPQVEDLSQQEEESINLFITLMTNIKSDPTKQANILYDSNLSELHGKIIQLKPKLNKSLRASIEKYETCLELNNKISTISRLYDQFLEAKLNQAYGNHAISSPYLGPNQTFQEPYPSQTSNEYVPYPEDQRVQSPSQYQQNQPQFNNYSSTSMSQQPTGYNNYPSTAQNFEQVTQKQSQQLQPHQTMQASQQGPPPTSFHPSYYQESDPETSQNQENGTTSYYSYRNESDNDKNESAYPYQSAYPPQESNGSYTQNTPSYPNYNTSLPTEPSYPPFEQDNAEKHAAAKFPSIDELNSSNQSYPGDQDDDKLPSMSSMPQIGQPSQESDEKIKLIEEPLIEL